MEIDLHDRVMNEYCGKMGEKFMQETQTRVNWICAHTPGRNILDVGCLQEIVPILLAREGRTVTGIVINPSAIEKARQLFAQEPKKVQDRISFINTDFMEMDIRPNKFDSVIVSGALELLTKPSQLFKKAAALLTKTDGTLVVTIPFDVNDPIDHKQTFYLKEPLELLGHFFEKVDYEILGKWIGFVAKMARKQNAKKANVTPCIVNELLYLDRWSLDELKIKASTTNLNNRNLELLDSLKEANTKYSYLQKQLFETEQQLQEARLKAEEVPALKQKLDSASEKYRHATGSVIPALKERLETLTKELSATNNKRLAAEKRVFALRSSLTFKTGYMIRSQSRSLIGIFKLPLGLWRIYRQALKQSIQPSQNQSSPIADLKAEPIRRQSLPSFRGPLPIETEKLTSVIIPPDFTARELRVACIMDDFTFASYQPECNLQQLTPANWQTEIGEFDPELLFIESAWRGKDDLWGSKVGHRSQEITGIVDWCRERNVPTVFWNKEDPVHFETFLNTAKLFDFVFTTDIDCIHRYKAALGHKRIYLLPFACQPALHNPIEKYQRSDAFCFAGAYYVRYPHRTHDLATFVEELPNFRPLVIYDRNYGKVDPNYRFPKHYQPYIVGTLPFSEIDKAYKGYRYAINLNSIKQSQTMFARRVLELMGSNTLTISNYSRGVRLMFGDLVINSDSGREVVSRLKELTDAEPLEAKTRLAALRKIMLEHTYGERLDYILAKIRGKKFERSLPSFTVISPVNSATQLENIVAQTARQRSVDVKLIAVGELDKNEAESLLRKAGLNSQYLATSDIENSTLAELSGSREWIAGFSPFDYYGANYLLDIALATRYSQAIIIGKSAYHHWTDEEVELINADAAYRPADALPIRASAISSKASVEIQAKDWLQQFECGEYELPAQLGIDAFNYCRDGQKEIEEVTSQVRRTVDDLVVHTGINIDTLLHEAESIEPAKVLQNDAPSYDAEKIAELIGPRGTRRVSIELDEHGLRVASRLPDGKHEYIYAYKDVSRDNLMQRQPDENRLPLFLETEPGLNVSLVLLFLDKDRQRISHKILGPNSNHSIELPLETNFIRLGFRVYAGGQTTIKRLILGQQDLPPSHVFGRSDVLLLTNHYPCYDDLYRNAFVHSRVSAYKARGIAVDVFRLRTNEPISWHEFQNIDVTTGSQAVLYNMLASGQYRHVLVHFLDEAMWEVLSKFITNIRVTVWIHGSEMQPWWRRRYNYENEDELALAKLESDKRLSFWQSILKPMPEKLSLIFVSNYFAKAIMKDLDLSIPIEKFSIIHNPIDTDLFNYQSKPSDQRKKILSIRPYASKTYANDLSVKAILLLSTKPWFDELEFHLIGDGKLFDDTLKPLRKFKNVIIERRFLPQKEIANLHKEFGIFLCPTRMDSQGVSRDEAMASGLVPVTSAVAAIPEFVDKSCGILAEAEDHAGLADGIAELVSNPKKWADMSKAAHDRVMGQSSHRKVITEELKQFMKWKN